MGREDRKQEKEKKRTEKKEKKTGNEKKRAKECNGRAENTTLLPLAYI